MFIITCLKYTLWSGPKKSAFNTLEGTQEIFRVREILKVLNTESYRTDSHIRLGTCAYRRRIPVPFGRDMYFLSDTGYQIPDIPANILKELIIFDYLAINRVKNLFCCRFLISIRI